jgi:hypothetical protein
VKSSVRSKSSAAVPKTTPSCWVKLASARRPSLKVLLSALWPETSRTAGRETHRGVGPGNDGGRHEVSRSVRRADQGGDERGSPRQEYDPVHRRTAHAGGCWWCGGRYRRGQRAEACIGSRRDPVHRGDHAGRVSQIHRKGQRTGPTVPRDHCRSNVQRRDDRDPQRTA